MLCVPPGQMLTACASLHSSCRLPIIIAMKIRFRIGAEQGNEQEGPRSPGRYCSANSTVRSLDPTRLSGARFLRPFTLLALTKEGSICEGGRFSGVRRLRALPLVPIPLLPRQPGLKPGTKLGESEQRSDISIRHSPKYRSHRKQTIKPCLSGARIAHSDLRLLHPGCFSGTRFPRDFASVYPACPDEGRELSRKGMLSRDPLFESRTLQQDVRFSSSSTRFWSKSRSHRKQTIKPFLPGSRNARCVTGSLHDSRTLFVPAVASATSA